jgi:hypothetical protein
MTNGLKGGCHDEGALSRQHSTVADTFYIPYLLVLLVLPLLVRWRWGLVASLIVVVVELGLVALIFYLLNVYRVFPDPFAGEPRPQAPMEIMRRAGRELWALPS